MDAGQYWLVSVPAEPSKSATWKRLGMKLSKEHSYTTNFRLNVPELRIGTLDGLILLSDEMQKVDQYCEQVVQRITKVFSDLQKNKEKKRKGRSIAIDKLSLMVGGVPFEQYLQSFKWDTNRYPTTVPTKELVRQIQQRIEGLEEQVREKAQEYANTLSQLLQMDRAATGSLALRDLTGVVKESDFVESERLTTALVVVPRFQFSQFEKEYHTLVSQKIRDIQSSFIVPNSHRKLCEDKEHGLYSVVLFKRVFDDFSAACRQKRYIVRDFSFSTDGAEQMSAERAALEDKQASQWAELTAWCRENFGEAFSALVHLKVIRLFVETILRYGVPPNFLPVLMKLNKKCEKKLHAMLCAMYGHLANSAMTGAKLGSKAGEETGVVASLASSVDFHPYVVFKLDLTSRE